MFSSQSWTPPPVGGRLPMMVVPIGSTTFVYPVVWKKRKNYPFGVRHRVFSLPSGCPLPTLQNPVNLPFVFIVLRQGVGGGIDTKWTLFPSGPLLRRCASPVVRGHSYRSGLAGWVSLLASCPSFTKAVGSPSPQKKGDSSETSGALLAQHTSARGVTGVTTLGHSAAWGHSACQ